MASIEGMRIGDCYEELRQMKFAGSVTQACAESIMLEQTNLGILIRDCYKELRHNVPVPLSDLKIILKRG